MHKGINTFLDSCLLNIIVFNNKYLIKKDISMQELADMLHAWPGKGCWLCWLCLKLIWWPPAAEKKKLFTILWAAALCCINPAQHWHCPLVASRGNSNILNGSWRQPENSLEKVMRDGVGYVQNWGTATAVKGKVPTLFLQSLLEVQYIVFPRLWYYRSTLDCLWSVVGECISLLSKLSGFLYADRQANGIFSNLKTILCDNMYGERWLKLLSE